MQSSDIAIVVHAGDNLKRVSVQGDHFMAVCIVKARNISVPCLANSGERIYFSLANNPHWTSVI